MAKPLNERVTSALASDRVTLTDLRTVIADAREELERQKASREAAKADTADLALSDDDRDEAAKNLARADGMIVAYTAAIAELEEKLEGKNASEKRQAEEAEQAAAIAERDALAERFKAVVPEAVATLTALFDEIQANTKRLKKAGCRNAADAVQRYRLARAVDLFRPRDVDARLNASVQRSRASQRLVAAPHGDELVRPLFAQLASINLSAISGE
jgi:hypothetical protein